MSFFKSFWRETGKNTGKWASNKVFGSGWSTPFRHIVQSDTPTAEGLEQLAENLSNRRINEPSGPPVDRKYLYKKASELQFDGHELDEICKNMDELLLGAHQAVQDQSSVDIFTIKIRSGIHRLLRMGETDLAAFYTSELEKLNKSVFWKKVGFFLLMVLVFGGLIFFAFFMRANSVSSN